MDKFKLKTVEVYDNVRVEILSSPSYYMIPRTGRSQAEIERDAGNLELIECKRLEAEAKRHIDDYASICTLYRIQIRCIYCNSVEEYDDDDSPVCCEKAIQDYEEFIKRNAEPKPDASTNNLK